MFTKVIRIGTDFQKDIKVLVSAAERHTDSIKAISGPYVVNAKSLLGVLSLDLTKPIEIMIETDDKATADSFYKEIKSLVLK